MKKYFLMMASLLVAAGCLMSCGPEDTPEGPDGPDKPAPSGNTPTVSISADSTFGDDYYANITLTLSEVSASDVIVRLKKTDVQSGKTSLPADYDKKVTIPAGDKSVVVKAKADVMGLAEGEYQHAVKIDSAEGANVAENAVAYINITFKFVPTVNLYADSQFAANCTAKLQVALEKAIDETAEVTLELDPASKADVTFDKKVTIPAGETSVEVIVTVTVPAGLENGIYPAIINIASTNNCKAGNNKSATINLQYPFGSTIFIDGEFDDWASAASANFACPEGALYDMLIEMRVAASPSKVWLYFAIQEPTPNDFNMSPMPIDIWLDKDGNPATGGKLTDVDGEQNPFTDSGVEWYNEFSNVHEGDGYCDYAFGGAGCYKYTGVDGGSIWSLENQFGKYGADEITSAGYLDENGVSHVEVQFSRKYFDITGTKVGFGIKLMSGNNNWNCWGLLPQGPCTNGARKLVDMAYVDIPAYEE